MQWLAYCYANLFCSLQNSWLAANQLLIISTLLGLIPYCLTQSDSLCLDPTTYLNLSWSHRFVLIYQKTNIWFTVSSKHKPIFCIQDCHSQIAQVKYQGQTKYTKMILDSKLLSIHINTRTIWIMIWRAESSKKVNQKSKLAVLHSSCRSQYCSNIAFHLRQF